MLEPIVADLCTAWAKAATPPPRLTVSQWADAVRRLPESSGAAGARWRTADVPYLRGIMDAAHEPGVKTIALRKAAQVGGSEALHNVIGYFIEYDPCPMLMIHPSDTVAEEWSKERLADMIRTTPALDAVVRSRRVKRDGHQGESTLALKMFPGGFLALGGANTPNTFARRSARIVMGDDVDRWPAVVGEEGDPIDLLKPRTRLFHDGIVLVVSTPTLKHGRIDTLFDRGDQRQYMLQCPGCGRFDFVTWSDAGHFRVVWREHNPETARIVCPACEYAIDEPTRRRLVAEGMWQPTADPIEPGLVSFHLPAMITTLGQASIAEWVGDWLTATSKGKESTRVFVNTTLAEGWEDRTAKMDPHALYRRREDYGGAEVPEGAVVRAEVPEGAVVLTAGVDVQADRFEITVTGWGFAFERWVVDVARIPGDPKKPETRAALLEALGRKYTHASGHQIGILSTCLDTGYATEELYDFVLAYQARRIYATKGFAGRGGTPIVGKVAEKRYGKSARPVPLWPINVDDAKAEIMASLALEAPAGPNVTHFPLHLDAVNEEYFSQLTAEHKETKYNKSKIATHIVWVQDRERNEALDCAVLCLAAFRLLNPNIRQHAEALRGDSPTMPKPPAPVRSGFLGPRRSNWLRGDR